jgi:fumarate reductase subunit D
LLPFLFVIVAVIVILAFVFMWISARGRFIFLDCVVKNRAAIVSPWKDYRREGNSFFLFSLAVMALAMVIMLTLVLAIVIPFGLLSGDKSGIGIAAICAMIFFALVWVGFVIIFAVVTQFMVPVMYRRRCLAREAFSDVWKLIRTRPGPFVLFVLFGIVLALALLVTGTIVSCMTCCIAGLPYVSSVVLLPAFVWLLGFKLLFLRQFGPEYDVWTPVEIPAPALPTDPSSASPSPTE